MNKLSQKYLAATLAAGAAFQAAATTASAKTQSLIKGDFKTPTGYATDLGGLLQSVLNFVMVIAALMVFFYLIYGGIEWISSGGDKGKTESARNKITAAVVGLIILAASYAIFIVVLNFLGFGSIQEALTLQGIQSAQ